MKKFFLLIITAILFFPMKAQEKDNKMLVRIAEIEIFPEYLDQYLKEAQKVGAISVEKEKGVICIFPMQVNRDKHQIRILEIYADQKAYEAHIASEHFQTYKQGTLKMVKTLNLIDTQSLDPEAMRLIFTKTKENNDNKDVLQSHLKTNSIRRIITIEEHFIIPEISARVTAFVAKQNGGKIPNADVQQELMKIVLPNNKDITDVGEHRLKFMNEAGIDMQVLSYGAGSPQNITDKALALELCRKANDRLAQLISLHPTRFAGFAVLPASDPSAAAAELERAIKKLGLKGAALSGTFNGRFFDEKEFQPIFAKAEALNVPIYMHPAIIEPSVANYYYRSPQWSPVAGAMFATAGFGWHADSGIAVIRMIISGLFEKYPNLQIISGHWGELVPFHLNRLDDQQSKTLNLPRKISDYYKTNIFITPSGLFSEAQLKFCISEVGADRIIYSGDYPFLIDKDTRKFLEEASISAEDKDKIGYKNAEKLLNIKQ